ncbi:MAG: hypothetical protein AAF824_08210 [Bacteroidota bacterium]
MRPSAVTFTFFIVCISVNLLFPQEAEHISMSVNSEFEEREPIPSADGKTLYFWRRDTPFNTGGTKDPGDIWMSTMLSNGTFTRAINMNRPTNSNGHDFVWQVSPYHDTLWVNQTPAGSDAAVPAYSIKNRQGEWRKPRPLRIQGFEYKGNYKDYFMTPQRVILLPNEGNDTYGGSDIYVCFPTNDTSWSKPVNIGPTINSFGDDDAPYLAPDGKTLYFNSNGHGGYGNHDVFMSTRLDNTWTKWSEPVNIGPPVNTAGYDFDFTIDAKGENAYWGSDKDTYGDMDIFRLDLTDCQLDVFPKGDQSLCQGDELTLSSGFVHAQRSVSYQWFKNGTPIQGATASRLKVTEEGYYALERTKDGCKRRTVPQKISYAAAPQANMLIPSTVICQDDSVRLRAIMSETGVRFQWNRNGLALTGETEKYLTVTSPGEYQVEISNQYCSTLSEVAYIERLGSPRIFFARDTQATTRLKVPKWDWTNRLSKQKGDIYIRDIAIGENEQPAILYIGADKKGRLKEYISTWFPGGPQKQVFAERKISAVGDQFLAVDPLGNVITTSNESYLAKYSPSGKLLWNLDERRLKVNGVSTDASGNIYTMGRFNETLILEGKAYEATQRGNLYLVKHAPNGEILWAKTYSIDWYKHDFGNAVHTDCQGNVYIAGGFKSIANFRNRILRAPLGGGSYFLAKLSSEGELLWTRKINTEKVDFKTCDTYTDCEGNSYLMLNYKLVKYDPSGRVLFEDVLKAPGVPHKLRVSAANKELFISGSTSDKQEFFVTKLDRNENQILLWKSKGTSIMEGHLPAVGSDAQDNVYVAGVNERNLPPGVSMAIPGSSSAFIAKYGRPRPEIRMKPISLCESESGSIELMVKATDGLTYQWVRNGDPISGATFPSLIVSEEGEYQVIAKSVECENISQVQVVSSCADFPEPTPVPVASREPKVTPKPKPALNKDLVKDAIGKPRRLRGRRVKEQDDIAVSQRNVIISVFDHGASDQDTISLNINGTWVLREYELKKSRMEIEYTLQPGIPNFIILYAHNLGTTPPNTASILVDDGRRKQRVKLESNLRTCGTVNINVE